LVSTFLGGGISFKSLNLLTFKLKEHLKKETNYSIEEIDSICSQSTINTWPESFRNDFLKQFENVPDQAYEFKKLFFYN
jgi:hypothetical protein